MNHTLCTLLLSATLAPCLFAQDPEAWELLPNSPDARDFKRHEDVFFTTPAVGWVVNSQGELHRTTDGGESWILLNTVRTLMDAPIHFRSTSWAGEKTGWIGTLTAGNVLYESKDGGETLEDVSSRLPTTDSLGICGLWAVNEDVVYGVGRFYGPARFIKTTDGGLTWSVKHMDEWAGRLVDVMFFDEMNGIVVGGTDARAGRSHATVLRTEDGGETWETAFVSSEPRRWGWKIAFPTREVGYVSIESVPINPPAHLLKTTDGGMTWTEIQIDSSRTLQAVGFITPELGWTSGRGQTSATTSGGSQWEQIPLDGAINRIRNLGDSLAYAVGKRVYRYRLKKGTDVEAGVTLPPSIALHQNFPNPFSPNTTIEYEVHSPTRVRLRVFDLMGRVVRVLVDGQRASGSHQITWGGTAADGRPAAPGIYLYTLTAGERTRTRRMVLMPR